MTSCYKKWGASKKDFLPSMNQKPVIDSHQTLSKTDKIKVNNILNRNAHLYHSYAKKKLAEQTSKHTSRVSFLSPSFLDQTIRTPELLETTSSFAVVGDRNISAFDLSRANHHKTTFRFPSVRFNQLKTPNQSGMIHIQGS